jgi:FkbM family methyltransferase
VSGGSPALLYGMIQSLSQLIPPAAKVPIRKWLGIPDLEVALDRLRGAGFRPRFIVDVGAFIGDWTVMARRLFPEARVLMVEPQPNRAPALQAVAARLPDVRFASALLGATPAPAVTFFQNETVSSVLEEPDNPSAAAVLTLPMTTLDAVVAESGFGAPDFLKLDVQGYELEVLRGASSALAGAEVVLLEVNLIPINKGAPLLAETTAFMAARGFRAYDICSEIRRPLDGALWQTDMLFARESSPLVASTRWI